MNFTPELSAFQGAIIAADNVYHFSRLKSRGGNQDKIDIIIENLKSFLKNERYINDIGPIEAAKAKLRKFALYIVLNADLSVLEDMVRMESVDMVIWTIPTVPKHLMCEMLWNLHMEEFVYEIITYCSPELAVGVANAFVYHFKYFSPTECLQRLHKLSLACYKFIGRFNCFQLNNETLAHTLISAADNLKRCLVYFTEPPNSHRLANMSKDVLYKYNGRTLHTLLLLICECFDHYTREIDWNDYNDIYKLTFKEECLKDNISISKICDTQDKAIVEHLTNAHIALLDIFQVVVMGISVDIFCSWSETEEDGKNMQQTIGELCDKVRTTLLSIESVAEHPVINMIQQMARKPVNINDTINLVSPEEILAKINSNNPDKQLWIQALMYREELCEHSELLHILDTYLHTFNEADCLTLFTKFMEHSKNSDSNNELIRLLIIKAFYYCNMLDKHKILQDHFCNNCFHNISDNEDYHYLVTEMFNKFVASNDVNECDVLCAFFQNPRAIFSKTFTLAAENSQMTETMLRIIKLLENFSNHYYNIETEATITSIVKNILENNLETDKQRENLIKFICALKNIDIIPKTKLLLLIIMPVVHKALINKDVVQICTQIQLLGEAYTIDELLEYRAPMLAMVAQVLEVVRWRKTTMFTPHSPITLQLSLQFLTDLIKTYNNTIPDFEGSWLRQKLKLMNMQPLNNYYFSVLWNPKCSGLFETICHIRNLRDANKSDLAVWLTHIITAGTQNEWCTVWDEISQQLEKSVILGLFHEAMRIITRAVDENRTESTKACLFYCYTNLVYVIRYKFFEEPLSDSQVTCCVNNLTRLIERTAVDDINEIGTRLMPLLAYLAERKQDYAIDVNIKFKHTKYSDLVSRVFSNGTI